jgi:hypothetical protein
MPVSWSRSQNTIAKLVHYGIVLPAPVGFIGLGGEQLHDLHLQIADRVATEFLERLSRGQAWNCLRLDPTSGSITIDAMTMPIMADGLSMWVTEFGIAERNRTEARHWRVTERYRASFMSAVSQSNRSRPKRAKSAERLAAELAHQAEAGEAAELWVVQFERERLHDHPFRDNVRQVSVDDVAAGYDIASFSAPTSLQHDLFIEVKSHGARKLFHWSRNEIATAIEFGEGYALYLVDRARMAEPGYKPHIISAPTPEMFSQPGSGWSVEATSFEHVAVES